MTIWNRFELGIEEMAADVRLKTGMDANFGSASEVSIAMSLKRIADSVESIARTRAGSDSGDAK